MSRLLLNAAVRPTRGSLMMGGGSIAGLFRPCPEAMAMDTVRTALILGVTHFDTAPHYALGVSEERLGTAIGVLGNDLSSPQHQCPDTDATIRELREAGAISLWTKTGRIVCAAGSEGAVLQAGEVDASGVTLYDLLANASMERDELLDYSAAGAGRSLKTSEARFGGHRVAGLRLHDADTDELVDECLAPDGMVAGLRALREAGRVEQVSLGMNMVVAPQILRLLREAPEGTWDNIMLAHGWNLLCQDGLEVVEECTARGISIHNAGVYCSGLLVGGDTYFYSEAPAEMRAKAQTWAEIAADFAVPLPAIAINFGLMPRAVSHVVCGWGTPEEVLSSVEWAETAVPPELWEDGRVEGLLPDAVVEAIRS